MKNFTVAQITALRAAKASTFQTAVELGATGATMTSLVRQGLVEARWSIHTGKVGTAAASYRITGKGLIARHTL